MSYPVINAMHINVISQMDTLQDILDKCCEEHQQCHGCKHLHSCRRLWDKASEQAYSKSFNTELLLAYIEEFNTIWKEDPAEKDLFPCN